MDLQGSRLVGINEVKFCIKLKYIFAVYSYSFLCVVFLDQCHFKYREIHVWTIYKTRKFYEIEFDLQKLKLHYRHTANSYKTLLKKFQHTGNTDSLDRCEQKHRYQKKTFFGGVKKNGGGGYFKVTEGVGVSHITFQCSTMQVSSAVECRSALQQAGFQKKQIVEKP